MATDASADHGPPGPATATSATATSATSAPATQAPASPAAPDQAPNQEEGPAGQSPNSAGNPAEESTLTVLLALGANVGVGILKLVAGLITGSGALLSEAAHSAGDSSTEVLLLTALKRSERPADRVHPFGYGKERYFWSLLAAVTILVSGAAFSIYQGLHTILGPAEDSGDLWINYPVLAIAAVLEGASFRQALNQAKGAARKGRRSVRSYIRDPEDPTVKSVVLEDSAALIGLLLAGLGVLGHQLTGNKNYDGAASLAIGVLLVFAAFALAQSCKGLLIGKQADLRFLQILSRRLEQEPEIVDVVDVQTMLIGVDRILLCTRVDFEDGYTAADVENACVRIDQDLREEFPSLAEVFIQPVPRSDARLRERVLSRYGRVLADEPDSEAQARRDSAEAIEDGPRPDTQ